ncbi:hypothetical protein [Nonomuraea sp. NEAU-A123]|uniref:hypothetical protein n=1 Tax=Nonomuraea sp. NEAU-A123 TaxID=2839649 RepID=UPI001BE3E011|nr:hypothetical protein [Nonomuraea sp. NEAU-A123]MBT2229577.1 hypothetical protein [Nonomuraea sp. NEAU-A123]
MAKPLQGRESATPGLWHTTDVLGERGLVRVNQRMKPAPAGDLGELAGSPPSRGARRRT